MPHRRPALSTGQILEWADDHHGRTGTWPKLTSGLVLATSADTWKAIDLALSQGHRGLPGGDSLAQLLARERAVRNRRRLPRLSEETIIEWARHHKGVTGSWPRVVSGPVVGQPGEIWRNVEGALHSGLRGLPGGDTLARLLQRRLEVPLRLGRPVKLTMSLETILRWADAHYQKYNAWPRVDSDPEVLPDGETWKKINGRLRNGLCGLARGSSLAKLLHERRGVITRRGRPPRDAERR